MVCLIVYFVGFWLFGLFINLLLDKGQRTDINEYREYIANNFVKYSVILFCAATWVITFPILMFSLVKEG